MTCLGPRELLGGPRPARAPRALGSPRSGRRRAWPPAPAAPGLTPGRSLLSPRRFAPSKAWTPPSGGPVLRGASGWRGVPTAVLAARVALPVGRGFCLRLWPSAAARWLMPQRAHSLSAAKGLLRIILSPVSLPKKLVAAFCRKFTCVVEPGPLQPLRQRPQLSACSKRSALRACSVPRQSVLGKFCTQVN